MPVSLTGIAVVQVVVRSASDPSPIRVQSESNPSQIRVQSESTQYRPESESPSVRWRCPISPTPPGQVNTTTPAVLRVCNAEPAPNRVPSESLPQISGFLDENLNACFEAEEGGVGVLAILGP